MTGRQEYRYASLSKRIVAKSIDVLVAFGIIIIFAVLGIGSILWFLLSLGIVMEYMLLGDAMGGQSIGKRNMNLKVVDFRYGSSCTPFQSFIRNLSGLTFWRLLIEVEEEHERLKGRSNGTIVIDLGSSDAEVEIPPVSEEPARSPVNFDLEGVMDDVHHDPGETELK